MKISKYLMIDETVKCQKLNIFQIKHNRRLKEYYLLCTPVYDTNLFEIIRGQDLNEKYNDCYLIGLAKDEAVILDFLIGLIDKLYNLKELAYEDLKS